MTALACEKQLDMDLQQLSDENIVEVYVTAILNRSHKNLLLLEKELLKRRLFLVALERFDIKKAFFDSHFSKKRL